MYTMHGNIDITWINIIILENMLKKKIYTWRDNGQNTMIQTFLKFLTRRSPELSFHNACVAADTKGAA